MKRVAIYARANNKNYSVCINEQLTASVQYAQNLGYSIFKTYVEGPSSALDTNRPVLNCLLEDVKKHEIDILIIQKFDRLTRSARDFFAYMKILEDNSVILESVLDTPYDDSIAVSTLCKPYFNIQELKSFHQ